MHRLRWTYGLIAALVLIIAGYTAFWFHLKGRVEQGLNDWAAEQRAKGWQVYHSPPSFSGYPYRIMLELKEVALADPAHPQAWALRLASIKAVTHPWTLRHILLQPEGTTELAWTVNGSRANLTGTAEQQRASLALDVANRVQRFSYEALKPVLTLSTPRLAEPVTARADKLELHTRDNRGTPGAPTVADLAVTAEQLTASGMDAGPPFGNTIARLQLELGATGPIDARTVAVWRDAGGTVELRRLAVRWGPLDASTTGTLALDKQMRPLGALTAEAKGWEAVIDGLTERRMIARNQARTLKIALGLLAQPATDGGKVLRAPITAQDGKLFLGPVMLGDLPPLLPE